MARTAQCSRTIFSTYYLSIGEECENSPFVVMQKIQIHFILNIKQWKNHRTLSSECLTSHVGLTFRANCTHAHTFHTRTRTHTCDIVVKHTTTTQICEMKTTFFLTITHFLQTADKRAFVSAAFDSLEQDHIDGSQRCSQNLIKC